MPYLDEISNLFTGDRKRTSGPSMEFSLADVLKASLPGYGIDPSSEQGREMLKKVREESYNLGMRLGPGAMVFHGSPHLFDAFKMEKIGTGEGAQAYGHGLYFAESPGVAKSYAENLAPSGRDWEYFTSVGGKSNARNKVTGEVKVFDTPVARQEWLAKQTSGNLYKVDLPDESIGKMLDWDKPLSQQPEMLKKFREISKAHGKPGLFEDALQDFELKNTTGQSITGLLDSYYKGDRAKVSGILNRAGIPGIKYLDQGSRSSGKGTYNYVVFDENLPKIVGRE